MSAAPGLRPAVGVARVVARSGAGNPLLGFGADAGEPADRVCTSGGAAELVAAVGSWLRHPERRVAASMVVLGYAARLVGPTLAVLLRDGILLDTDPRRVRCSYLPGRGFSLGLPDPAGWRGPPGALRSAWCATVVDGHLRGLVGAVRSVTPVAAGLLWGNVASGVTGTLRALAADGTVPAGRCHEAGRAILAHGPLRGSGVLTPRLEFRRRSCCLYYRLEGAATCGDCPLRPAGHPPGGVAGRPRGRRE